MKGERSMSRSGKVIIGSMIVLLLLMLSTQPTRLPPVMLAVPFILIGTVMVLVFHAAFRWQGMNRAKSIRLSLIGTSLPMLVLILQALGQLTLRDLGTIVAIFGIAYFYLSRISKPVGD
jgi:hypothetical protein